MALVTVRRSSVFMDSALLTDPFSADMKALRRNCVKTLQQSSQRRPCAARLRSGLRNVSFALKAYGALLQRSGLLRHQVCDRHRIRSLLRLCAQPYTNHCEQSHKVGAGSQSDWSQLSSVHSQKTNQVPVRHRDTGETVWSVEPSGRNSRGMHQHQAAAQLVDLVLAGCGCGLRRPRRLARFRGGGFRCGAPLLRLGQHHCTVGLVPRPDLLRLSLQFRQCTVMSFGTCFSSLPATLLAQAVCSASVLTASRPLQLLLTTLTSSLLCQLRCRHVSCGRSCTSTAAERHGGGHASPGRASAAA